ncbi:MAG: hypothetical protein HC822_17325 [Oscillochloris sp.]|nr:hypothetical protein [Oscillochloris sp.]
MAYIKDAGTRILAAQANHCKRLAAELAAARASGATTEEIASLEAQEVAAHKRYQELAVDMPGAGSTNLSATGRRPWWQFW